MDQCDDCKKEAELSQYHTDGGGTVSLCEDCSNFPHHEYTARCAHCDLDILVN